MKETFNSKCHGEGSFSFRDLQQQKHLNLTFRVRSTQINDHLFPKVTAETILVQSKGFYKTEKTLQNVPRGERTGGGTEHPRSSLAKSTHLLILQLVRGLTKTGSPRESLWGRVPGRGSAQDMAISP